MSKFTELRKNPPRIKVKDNPREVIFTTISAMSDNVRHLRFSKSDNGDFKMSGMGFALSNWQFAYKPFEIEWAADEGDWDRVIRMINTGTSVISEARSR